MTNEEAIKGLKNVSTMFTGYKPNEEMFAMAIKALETVSCIKEKCAYCPHCENCDVDDETLEIKALEQQPCEDWYDVPSDEMTLEQARRAVKDLRKKLAEYLEQEPCDMKQRVEKEYLYESLCEDLKKANAEIKRLSEPFEDAISRKDMLAVFSQSNSLVQAWDGFEKLPSVTPKEKTAAWVPTDEEPHEDYECNKCGYAVSTFTANIEPHTEYKYCPNCGARMQEVEENG